MSKSTPSSIPDPVQIGDASRRSGVHVETIRYYERIGLVAPPSRNRGGRRLYSGADVRRLAFIRHCRDLGFSLDDVRALLDLVDGGIRCGEVRGIALAHRKSIQTRIAGLKRLDRRLGALARQCEGADAADCPVIDALFDGLP